MFWQFVLFFNDNLDNNHKFKKEKIVNNVSAWTTNQRNKYKKGSQPEAFTLFLQEIEFEFRSKYNKKKMVVMIVLRKMVPMFNVDT